MPLAEKVAQADYVIENTGSIADVERRTDEVLATLCERLDVDADRCSETTTRSIPHQPGCPRTTSG